jgi:Zn ribbon nucleic-acid-binding protein
VIYSLGIPLALMDIWVTVYQHVCFRAYGIPRVKRSDYVIIDRNHLRYLNLIEALNCVYCGYANGVISYAREIASRTEQHWRPIKHALRIRDPHARYQKFLDYGDAEGYRTKLEAYRKYD